jgi:O-antigen/teichoic acid export membrane protein
MIPRIENSLKNGNVVGYRKYLDKSLRFILILGVPCCFGLIVLAPEIIQLFAGDKYIESAFSTRLLSPIIIIVGLSNFVGLQVLYPNRKEKYFTIAVSIAALINAFFNYFMIPVFKQNGAILGTILAETIGLIIQIGLARKLLKDTELFSFNTVKYFLSGFIMLGIIFYLQSIIENIVLLIIICTGVGTVVYITLLIILHEKTIRLRWLQTKNRI